MTNPKNPRFKFRKAWSWPQDVEKQIAGLLQGLSLHVCAGDSKLGDYRLDLTKEADICGDMFNLPIRPATFDTVLCDPPWNIPYHRRHKLVYQLRNCLKPGGRLIFNCVWLPRVRGLEVEQKLCPTCGVNQAIYVGLPNATWRNVSFLFLLRRSALA